MLTCRSWMMCSTTCGHVPDKPELVELPLTNVVADFVEWFSLGTNLPDDTVPTDFGELATRLWRRYAMHGIHGLNDDDDDDDDDDSFYVTFRADPATGIVHAVDVSLNLTLCGLLSERCRGTLPVVMPLSQRRAARHAEANSPKTNSPNTTTTTKADYCSCARSCCPMGQSSWCAKDATV